MSIQTSIKFLLRFKQKFTYLFILLSGFANGSNMSTNRIGCWRHDPVKSQIARFKIKKAVAFLRIFLYFIIKYITNPFPIVAKIIHIACKSTEIKQCYKCGRCNNSSAYFCLFSRGENRLMFSAANMFCAAIFY